MITNLHKVMHGTAIKKHGKIEDIAGIIGMPVSVATTELSLAAESGRVIEADGKYMLSPAGHMILSSEYSRFYDALRRNKKFVDSYDRFEIINADLKQLITDWQTMELGGKRVPNDHSNAEYDDKVIGRLGDLHEKFEPILKAMIAEEARLAVYAEKLTAALEKAEDGDVDWVSDAQIESYHTVWFEMHEDLLRLLGRVREES